MITIPSTNQLGAPISRVTLLHSGGVGSTLVLYYLMKDITDRNLNVGLNVVTLDKPGDKVWNQKDVHFAASTAKKCQDIIGFDSDKLIIQGFYPHRSIDSDNPEHLSFRYFETADSDSDLVKKRFRVVHHRIRRLKVREYDSEINSDLDWLAGFDDFRWSDNISEYTLIRQIVAADSDGDSELARTLVNSYPKKFFKLLCQVAGGYGLSDIIYQGNYRNPPVDVQNNFKYGFGVDFTRPESARGLNANLDSEISDIDSERHYHLPSLSIRPWYEKRPLISKGDARDLYNNYYSQDSDLETLFWYTMSCATWWRREYRENEIYEDSELPLEWDSDSLLWDNENNQYIYQTRQLPLHKFLPHCRKCWQCQNRGYGFEAWLDSEDDAAWLRIENANNPPETRSPNDAIVTYDFRNNGSATTETANSAYINNVGTLDGLADLVGVYFYDSDAEELVVNNTNVGNGGVRSQNIRYNLDSDGKMSMSLWVTLSRTTGTLVSDVPSAADNSNYTGILEILEGQVLAGFANQSGIQTISNAGTVDSDTLNNIILTYDGDVMTVFVNGVQTAQQSGITRTLYNNNQHYVQVGFGNNNINYYHDIGMTFLADPGANDMNGAVKRFTMFNYAITAAEAIALYNSESLILT